jgi:hypothetical protein
VHAFYGTARKEQAATKLGSDYFGSLLALWALISICTGHFYYPGGRHSRAHDYYILQEPHGFWFMTAFTFAMAALCLFFGLTGRK